MATLSAYLIKRSKDICRDNECTEEEHHCESYAYIDEDMHLLDVCMSDYFQGSSKPYAAIPLPWLGTQKELKQEVQEQISDGIMPFPHGACFAPSTEEEG